MGARHEQRDIHGYGTGCQVRRAGRHRARGIGCAIGETMAVIMAGNQPRLTGSMLMGIRTMTANIVAMIYATGLQPWRQPYCDRR